MERRKKNSIGIASVRLLRPYTSFVHRCAAALNLSPASIKRGSFVEHRVTFLVFCTFAHPSYSTNSQLEVDCKLLPYFVYGNRGATAYTHMCMQTNVGSLDFM